MRSPRKPGAKRPGGGGSRDRRGGPRPSRPPSRDEREEPRERPAARAARPRGEERDAPPPRAAAKATPAQPAPAAAPAPTVGVQTVEVTPDEGGMRVDRFLEARFPGLSFSHIQRVVRKGELRVDGRRVETKDRLEAGQKVRIPPLSLAPPETSKRPPGADEQTRAFLKSIVLYEDDDMMVLDKPMGLAVQGGSGTKKHVDGMLAALTDKQGQKPRLVHRLDKDTSGCLVIAKTRFAASALAKSFRSRDTRKTYWALVAGVPRTKQGRISTYLAKGEDDDGDAKMQVARHGDEGASHAVTYYAVVETAAQKLAWLSLKPVTGRTHQLRAHTAHIGHPIVGDPKYFDIENWELPGGIQNKLHLLARRIVIPHPRTGKPVDVTAKLPPHMQQSWNLLGFDAKRYDPIEDAPEE
ncbi:RluA family pseudouridine synthase [Alsobacter sp. SYSU M60028]|uniref:Ribosomal large subunit pseudouridine synthase D n=1 Tax=Alsobacter ponti TaxID=2962936 RepID=A0ABT1LBZ6_9HYPH|nr:RluA family pseudouridine synthase [Alsobacter ponti]MCP8939010.1 RluA family pseudouridine synthase [Alsobacter ponti]